MLLQSRHNVRRSACQAYNAYNPVLALRAAFGTSASYLKNDDHTASTSEPPTTQPGSTVTEQGVRIRNGRNIHSKRAELDGVGSPSHRSKQRGKHDPARGGPPGLKDGGKQATTNGKPRTDAVDFIKYEHWQRHMANIREQSFRVKDSQWWEDDRSSSLDKVKIFMDYTPRIVQPQRSKVKTSLEMPWEADEKVRKGASVNACLAADIDNFAAWMKPTAVEQRARAAVVKETEELIRSVLTPESTGVELFGSEKNGIALPFSDIDLRIFDMEDAEMPHSRLLPRLRRIMTAMHASDRYMLATVRGAGHPILNCQHRESGIDIQIVAAHDATPQQEVIAKYIDAVPRLREVYSLVRITLSIRGLVDVYTGGIGSYGTFVMVLAALEHGMKHHQAKLGTTPNLSSATQLITFLEFYRKLDTQKYGVAVGRRTFFKKHESKPEELKAYSTSAEKRGDMVRAGQWELCGTRPFQPYLLCLQDPANPLNDLGRKGHAIKHIHATLAYLNQVLAANCLALKKWKGKQMDDASSLEPLLLPLVGRCHEVYSERRKKLEMFGNRLDAGSAVVGKNSTGGPLIRKFLHSEHRHDWSSSNEKA